MLSIRKQHCHLAVVARWGGGALRGQNAFLRGQNPIICWKWWIFPKASRGRLWRGGGANAPWCPIYATTASWVKIYQHIQWILRVETFAKRYMRSSMFTASFILVHVSNYRNFWNNERWKFILNILASWNCFTCRNLFQNGANDMSECFTFETAFCKKAQYFV